MLHDYNHKHTDCGTNIRSLYHGVHIDHYRKAELYASLRLRHCVIRQTNTVFLIFMRKSKSSYLRIIISIRGYKIIEL